MRRSDKSAAQTVCMCKTSFFLPFTHTSLATMEKIKEDEPPPSKRPRSRDALQVRPCFQVRSA